MAIPSNRRSFPVVDKAFQYKYSAIIVAIAVAVSTVLGYLLLQSYWETNRIMDLALESPEMRSQVNRDEALLLFKISLAVIVFEIVALGAMGLVITHRVCGPVFVIQQHLQTMLEGRYPRLRPIRKSDEFRETYDLFTALVAALEKRDTDEADTLVRAIAAAKHSGVPDADIAPLERLVAERRARAADNDAPAANGA